MSELKVGESYALKPNQHSFGDLTAVVVIEEGRWERVRFPIGDDPRFRKPYDNRSGGVLVAMLSAYSGWWEPKVVSPSRILGPYREANRAHRAEKRKQQRFRDKQYEEQREREEAARAGKLVDHELHGWVMDSGRDVRLRVESFRALVDLAEKGARS